MPYVYRLETETGRGVYRSEVVDRWENDKYHSLGDERHPAPWRDPLLGPVWNVLLNQQDYQFGFTSKKQVRQWFHTKEWRDRLMSAGVLMAKYRVPQEYLIRGKSQAAFRKDKSMLVDVFYRF